MHTYLHERMHTHLAILAQATGAKQARIRNGLSSIVFPRRLCLLATGRGFAVRHALAVAHVGMLDEAAKLVQLLANTSPLVAPVVDDPFDTYGPRLAKKGSRPCRDYL